MDFDSSNNNHGKTFIKLKQFIIDKKYNELESYLEAANDEFKNQPDYFWLKTILSYKLNEQALVKGFGNNFFDAVKKYKNTLSQSNSNLSIIYNACAFVECLQDNTVEADELYQKAIELDSTNIDTIANYIKFLKRQNRNQDAEILLSDLIENYQDNQELKMLASIIKSKSTISACLIVKNEEELLGGCLESIKNIVDEIILVDTGSTDKTIDIARNHGAKIYNQVWENNFSKHRNFSIENAVSDWILIIDADERIDENSVGKIIDYISNEKNLILNFRVINTGADKKTEGSVLNSVRMFKRGLNLRYRGVVHNELVLPENIPVTGTDIDLIHLGYHLSPDKMRTKFERTLQLLKVQLEDEPDNPYVLFNYTQQLKAEETVSNKNNTDKIISAAKKAVALAQKDIDKLRHIYLMAQVQLAEVYLKKNNFVEAAKCCNEALSVQNNYLDALITLGFVHAQKQDYDKAAEYFQNYLDEQKKFNLRTDGGSLILNHADSRLIVYRNLGLIHEMKKNYAAAENYYRQVIDINPYYEDINICMGRISLDHGFWDMAEHYFTLQLQHGSDKFEAYLGLIKICVDRKDFAEGENYLHDLKKAYPNHKYIEEISENFGNVVKKLSHSGLSNGDIKKTLKKVNMLYDKQDFEKIISTLAPLKPLFSSYSKNDRIICYKFLAFAYLNIEKIDLAEEYINIGLKENADSLDFNYMKSFAALSMKEKYKAVKYAEKYIELYLNYRNKSFPKNELFITGSNLSQQYNILGAACTDLNKIEEAYENYKKAIRVDKNNPLPYQNYARLVKHYKTDKEALEIIRQGIKNCNNNQELKMMESTFVERPSISACMMVKNEEEMLPGCLDSIRDWVDEIVLVDTGSNDKTVEIAKSYGAKIFHQPWEGNFSKHRNYSIELATSDWIFIIDADERFDQKDVPGLLDAVRQEQIQAISVNVDNYYKVTGVRVALTNSTRFFRNKLGFKYEGIVHNSLQAPDGIVIHRAPFTMIHLGYDLTKDKMEEKFKRTKALLEKQIEENPKFAFAWFNMAQLMRNRIYDNPDEYASQVIEASEKALEYSNPNDRKERFIHLMAHDQLAWVYLALKNYEKAEKYALDVLKLKPNYLDPIITLGHIYTKTDQYDKAVEYFEKFIEMHKNYDVKMELDPITIYHIDSPAPAYFGLAHIYELKKENEKAIEFYKKALEQDPGYLDAAFHVGRMYLTEENYQEAEKYFLQQINENKLTLLALFGLGNICQVQNRFEDAENYYKQALDMNPNNDQIISQLIELYQQLNKYEEIYVLLKDICIDNDFIKISILGDSCFKIGKYEDALQYYNKVLEQRPNSHAVLNDLGNCFFKLNQFEQAGEYYQKSIKTGRADFSTYLNSGLNYLKIGNGAEAISIFNEGLSKNPNNFEFIFSVANILKNTGQYLSAIEKYEVILKNHPQNAFALFGLSDCYLLMGKGDAAIAGYGKVLAIDPAFEPVKKRLKELETLISGETNGWKKDKKKVYPNLS